MARRSWGRRILRYTLYTIGVLAVLLAGAALYVVLRWDRPASGHPVAQLTAPKDARTIARGKYLYEEVSNCWGCHGGQGGISADEPQSGGRVFDARNVGPGFGMFYASNLTPDPETGVGRWTDGELVRALREGINREGQLIFPIMPYEWLHGMSDPDALAIVAYIRSLRPVRHAVPKRQLMFPAKALIAFGVLKPAPAITAPVVAPPAGPTKEYGKYLSTHLSGCAECHTPRDFKNGQYDHTRPMGGGLAPFPEEGFKVAGTNLTAHATGLGAWSEKQFVEAMRKGLRPDGTVVIPFMPWPTYARWQDNDLRAVWLYLRSLAPVDHRAPTALLTGPGATGSGVARGKGLYHTYCMACHGAQGQGGRLAPLVLGQSAAKEKPESLAARIAEGTGGSMPGFGKTLKADQIADLVAYLRTLPQQAASVTAR